MASNIVEGVNEQLEAQTQVWNHLFSFINSMSLKCAVELGIPDIIYDHGSPISLTDLAAAIPIPSSKTDHLYRLMRILVHTNIFNLDTSSSGANEGEEEGYILTPSSNLLVKSKRDANLSPFLLMMLDRSLVSPWHCFGQWFKSEEPTAFKISHGATMWEVANECPEFNNKFNEAMATDSGFMIRALISKCGNSLFGNLKSLVDVGGGTGDAARAIAEAFPDLKVTVLDLPHVVADLPPHTGITFVEGDMFQQIPPGQAIFLKWILHDWNDKECVKILQKCKEAIPSKEEGGKKSANAIHELETLKSVVLRRIEELNRKLISQIDRREQNHRNNSIDSSLEWPPSRKQNPDTYELRQPHQFFGWDGKGQGSLVGQNTFSYPKAMGDQFLILSLSIPRPKEETLSRHSILGPNGLRGQWQPPTIDKGVQYPTNLDLTPIVIPSLHQPVEGEALITKSNVHSDSERSTLEAVLSLDDGRWSGPAEEPCSVPISTTLECPAQMDIIRQPSPPPVLTDVQDLIPLVSPQITESQTGPAQSLQDELVQSESPLQLHISTKMMDSFMRLAKYNTEKNLETCGVLAGSLKNRKFYITALIIPKQESTSDSCQTTNEEEIFDVQDKQSLFPLGWIHTHPTQSCFMSSIDLHTHYSYQIMLPEAIAIVMAPRDSSRTHGVFRLTTPGGMSVIRQCQQRGFHPHDQPQDGGPIYDHCTDVYMNPNLKFDVIDLR